MYSEGILLKTKIYIMLVQKLRNNKRECSRHLCLGKMFSVRCVPTAYRFKAPFTARKLPLVILGLSMFLHSSCTFSQELPRKYSFIFSLDIMPFSDLQIYFCSPLNTGLTIQASLPSRTLCFL